MNDTLDPSDEAAIARMRSALDEVATGIDDRADVIPLRAQRPAPRRWIGIAAATVLLAGGATFALTRRSSDDPVATNEDTTTSAPSSTIDPSSIWYTLSLPGFEAAALEQQAVIDGPSNPVVTWIATSGAEHGVLSLTQYFNGEIGLAQSNATESVVNSDDGSQLWFRSYGMTQERREALIAQVVPGSGVPFVLPDPSMTLLSVGDLGPATDNAMQMYTNGDEWATIVISSDRGIGNGLALSTALSETVVDGYPAYRSTASDGTTSFVWRVATGRWATLIVSKGLGERADEIAASLTRAPLPPFDPASTGATVTTIVEAAAPSTTLVAAQADIPWFTITSPDVTLGDVQHHDPLPLDQQELSQSWIVDGSDGRGFVTVHIAEGLTPGVEGDYTVEDLDLGNGVAYFLQPNGDDGPLGYGYELPWWRVDGTAWRFQSQGLSRDQLVTAVSAAVPGSGVPIVIADPTFTTMAISVVTGEQYVQTEPAGKGQIALTVEKYGLPLSTLISTPDITDVTVAGMPGYRGTLAGGQVVVAWDAGNGWWGHLWLGTDLAPNADAIIASIVPARLPD